MHAARPPLGLLGRRRRCRRCDICACRRASQGLIIPMEKHAYTPSRHIGPKGWAIGRWNTSALARINHRLPRDCAPHACNFEQQPA